MSQELSPTFEIFKLDQFKSIEPFNAYEMLPLGIWQLEDVKHLLLEIPDSTFVPELLLF